MRSKFSYDKTANIEQDENKVQTAESGTSDISFTNIQIRIEGKKKIYNAKLQVHEPLGSIFNVSPLAEMDHANTTITCVSRKLIVKSNDSSMMGKSFLELKLYPSVAIVIKCGGIERSIKSLNLKDRAELRRVIKRGEHTMQSVGIYAKDDGAKGELIDGGGGVWYEHDVSDDEENEEHK
jgi:hypothetical protein